MPKCIQPFRDYSSKRTCTKETIKCTLRYFIKLLSIWKQQSIHCSYISLNLSFVLVSWGYIRLTFVCSPSKCNSGFAGSLHSYMKEIGTRNKLFLMNCFQNDWLLNPLNNSVIVLTISSFYCSPCLDDWWYNGRKDDFAEREREVGIFGRFRK